MLLWRHNLNLLVMDINLCLFEFQLICIADILLLKSLLLLLGFLAKLRSLSEHFLERRALVLGCRRVTDLRVKFLPQSNIFISLIFDHRAYQVMLLGSIPVYLYDHVLNFAGCARS